MSRVIQDSITDGSLVLWHSYSSGNALDKSGNGNNGTLTNTYWAHKRLKFYPTSGRVVVPYSASTSITVGSLVVRFDTITQQSLEVFIIKSGNYQLYSTSDSIRFTGNIDSILVADLTGKDCIGATFASGEAASFYLNGIYAGDGALAPTVTLSLNGINIGSNGGTNATRNPMADVLIFNDKLTATEMAQVYSELHEQGGPSS